MRTIRPATLAFLALAPVAAAAQVPPPRLVVGAPGRCEMQVNGQPRPCTSGLVLIHHADGSILLSVQSGRDVTIGFQANADRQPTPESYSIALTRLHTSVSGRTAAKDVTGTCEIAMSTDGRIWHRATCRATDRSNIVTTMTFTGDGRPVTAERPGQTAPQPAAPRPAPAAPPAPAKN